MSEPLTTPATLAKFLVGMGYHRAEVVESVRADFPDRHAAFIERVVDDAYADVRKQDAELDRAVERDESAARAAEHDVSKTMHRPQEDS